MFWHPVYRSVELPAGRAKPLRIMSEDLTLYRGESGDVHAVAFRCAHRGTQLSTGWVEGENIRCFYHGWVYGPDGQCVEQPAEPEPFCNRIHIKSYPVQEYLGFIFAYLGEDEAPELPHYPDFELPGTLRVTSYVRECNYFNNIENGIDPAHVPFTHRGTLGGSDGLESAMNIRCQENEFGVLVFRGGTGGRPVYVEEHGMPNALLRLGVRQPRHNLAWRVPIDDETHASFNLELNLTKPGPDGEQVVVSEPSRESTTAEAARSVLSGELSMADAAERTDIVSIQDTLAQRGQGVIADRKDEHLGRSDVAVIEIRKVFMRELRALAEGHPVKQWSRAAGAAVEH